ncbi:MAG TPA: ribonuclease Y [Candidatus Sumerlaeota bacterium]|nr:MAG: Ribonuclease Y [candidate division BRC1 bacterium ADurb.BinA292]HOE95660.1 ribonuclease Y [Candidatus Sumerlaeota bacterium]
MESTALFLTGTAVGCLIGVIGARFYQKRATVNRIQSAREEARLILDSARAEADKSLQLAEQRAKEEAQRRVKQVERELAKRRHEAERRERKLAQREKALERREETIAGQEAELERGRHQCAAREAALARQTAEVEAQRAEAIRRCEEISGLTSDQARKLLLEILEADVRNDAAALVRRVETETRELANKKARQIITLAIQKCATDQVSETTVSVVNLPNDEMKGRIIGREGRNIRALEATTGCNIIVDDTPEAVVLSCFDPLRREVARLTLERLLGDGRIHPGRIEEVVAKVERELADHIREVGEQTVFDLGISDMHPELIKTLGRLKYRTSYGQNILTHSVEVARLCSHMAGELGADTDVAKRAGLLHDIGKALSYEMEGTHALIGADLAKKCNEAPGVVHAIAAHHNEEEPRTIIAVLVQAADAISSARPGVRRESLENYIKRMQRLEAIATGFPGVSKAFAIQAGRELRIMVEPTEVNDNEAALLARDVTKKIEQELEYPGQIKVTICREYRVTEYAK